MGDIDPAAASGEEEIDKKELWRGAIPTEISLAENDIATDKPLYPYYILLPRISYFSTAASDVVEHFKEETIDMNPNIWFEFRGKPLRGHLPIGVIFDQCDDPRLPWRIKLHFRELNVPQIVKLNTQEETSKYYFHCTKQAIYLLTGNTRIFTSLTIQQHHELMESISLVNPTLHQGILSEILSASFQPRAIPLRVVLSGRPVIQRPVAVYKSSDGVFVQIGKSSNRLQSRASIDEERGTISTRLSIADPDREMTSLVEGSDSTPDPPIDSTTIHDDDSMKLPQSLPISTLDDETDENEFVTLQDVLEELFPGKSMRCLIHGIELPRYAPMIGIWKKFSYPDLFLYLVVREDQEEEGAASS